VAERQEQARAAVALAPEEGVSFAIRFNPQMLEQYFANVRSPQVFVSAFEAITGVRLNEWERELLEKAWTSIALGTTPLFEVFPIAHSDAFWNSFCIECAMHIENLKGFFDKVNLKCLELYSKWEGVVKLGEKDKYAKNVEECLALTEYGPRMAAILALYILEFVFRKAQFSLPLGIMPNSAKAKGGLWTD